MTISLRPAVTRRSVRTTRLVAAPAVVLLLVALGACGTDDGGNGGNEPADGPLVVGERGVVLAPDDVAPGRGAVWMPDADDVAAADDALAAYQAAHPELGLDPYGDYYRQYVGIDGNAIHVNALCSHSDGWRSTYLQVDDGGSCYWQATVRDGKVATWTVNGSA